MSQVKKNQFLVDEARPDFPKLEAAILKFWEDHKIFAQLRAKIRGAKSWSFLDGPITANNPMGVHHAWGRTYKDLFQRYKAMAGFDQRFQNGFDCQGLWVEVEVEKELGFKSKKDIEKYGIAKFVEQCKARVRKYSAIQTQQSVRLGQWMDWPNSYFTMAGENNYAIWHFLKVCWQKKLIYKGHDSVPWCPRCETAISQHEILTEDYQELEHESIIMALPVVERDRESLLVWTTTPWTIPANIAVAVDEDTDYALVRDGAHGPQKFWVASALVDKIFGGRKPTVVKTVKGKKLVGLHYRTVFDDLPAAQAARAENPKKFHSVIPTDPLILPISAEEGTGLVHTAVSAGQEDFRLGKKLGLPMIAVIADNADYLPGLGEFAGQNAKKNPRVILDYMVARHEQDGPWVFAIFPYTHRYPACWRCKTELVWKVADEWYISMEKLRPALEKVTKKIKWIPKFGLERELDWLRNMEDWLISKKNRYWGLALPIYECKNCGKFEVIGSKEELQVRAVKGWEKFAGHSPHRPWVDEVKIKCQQCGESVSRILDVGNPWLDAGIVPFSTMGYFRDRQYWQKWFPADFICESFPGQFKNWFYSLIVMSAILEDAPPTKVIFGYALVRDEQGEEMHKSKGNAIWFDEAAEKIGVEVMRWMYLRQNPVDNLKFGFAAAEEVKRKLLTLWNSFLFFQTYVAKLPPVTLAFQPADFLDRWIVSRLNSLLQKTGNSLEKYDAAAATAAIENFFVEDLSLWYIRRSRGRFQSPLGEQNLASASRTLHYVLWNLTKILAPFLPFLAEYLYASLRQAGMPASVHLCDWPVADAKLIDEGLEREMAEARKIAEAAHALRAKAGIKLRQPLFKLQIKNPKLKIELEQILREEINVKEIIYGDIMELDTKIAPALQIEGLARELERQIQELRKESGFKIGQLADLSYVTDSDIMEKALGSVNRKKTYLAEVIKSTAVIAESGGEKTLQLEGEKIKLWLKP